MTEDASSYNATTFYGLIPHDIWLQQILPLLTEPSLCNLYRFAAASKHFLCPGSLQPLSSVDACVHDLGELEEMYREKRRQVFLVDDQVLRRFYNLRSLVVRPGSWSITDKGLASLRQLCAMSINDAGQVGTTVGVTDAGIGALASTLRGIGLGPVNNTTLTPNVLLALTRLHTLKVKNCSSLGDDVLSRLTSLNALVIESSTQVTDRGLNALSSSLRALSLTLTARLTDVGVASLQNLTALDLYRMIGVSDLSLSYLPSLTSLDVCVYSLRTGESLRCLTNLTHLCINSNSMGRDQARRGTSLNLADVSLLQKLTRFGLVGFCEGDAEGLDVAVTSLANNNTNLTTLWLDDSSCVSDETVAAMTGLRELSLQGSYTHTVAALTSLVSLTVLDVAYAEHIKDPQEFVNGVLPRLTALRQLRVSASWIGASNEGSVRFPLPISESYNTLYSRVYYETFML
jgi:hypothetical protein